MQRAQERRRREDDAPRLAAEVPNLVSLRLEIVEMRASGSIAESSHIRRVVVESAPALFVLPCRESECRDGGHDLTTRIMQALRRGEERFEGEDACRGSVGSGTCTRTVRYVGTAEYR